MDVPVKWHPFKLPIYPTNHRDAAVDHVVDFVVVSHVKSIYLSSLDTPNI